MLLFLISNPIQQEYITKCQYPLHHQPSCFQDADVMVADQTTSKNFYRPLENSYRPRKLRKTSQSFHFATIKCFFSLSIYMHFTKDNYRFPGHRIGGRNKNKQERKPSEVPFKWTKLMFVFYAMVGQKPPNGKCSVVEFIRTSLTKNNKSPKNLP